MPSSEGGRALVEILKPKLSTGTRGLAYDDARASKVRPRENRWQGCPSPIEGKRSGAPLAEFARSRQGKPFEAQGKPVVQGIEERNGWKSNLAWTFCGWWKTPRWRRRAPWDSATGLDDFAPSSVRHEQHLNPILREIPFPPAPKNHNP